MRILFDQGVPLPLRQHLSEHQVETAFELGWSRLTNWRQLREHVVDIVSALASAKPGEYLDLTLKNQS